MEISWPTIAITLATQVFVAWIAVRLALGRFRQERWWEKKYEAYSGMLTSLHQLRKSLSADYEASLLDHKIPADRQAQLDLEFRTGSDELGRYADLDDFLISKRAVELISRFDADVHAAKSEQSYQGHLDAYLFAVNRFLADLGPVAKRDLGILPEWTNCALAYRLLSRPRKTL